MQCETAAVETGHQENRYLCIKSKKRNKGEFMTKKFMKLGLFAVAMVLTVSSSARLWAQAAPRRVEITAKRFEFDPPEITLKKGEPVVLVLKSADVAHGLRFRELNIDIRPPAGGTAEVQFTPEKTGDFIGHCSVFCGRGHGSMVMKMHVTE
jgi:cytochrome c oxidase subunit II